MSYRTLVHSPADFVASICACRSRSNKVGLVGMLFNFNPKLPSRVTHKRTAVLRTERHSAVSLLRLVWLRVDRAHLMRPSKSHIHYMHMHEIMYVCAYAFTARHATTHTCIGLINNFMAVSCPSITKPQLALQQQHTSNNGGQWTHYAWHRQYNGALISLPARCACRWRATSYKLLFC